MSKITFCKGHNRLDDKEQVNFVKSEQGKGRKNALNMGGQAFNCKTFQSKPCGQDDKYCTGDEDSIFVYRLFGKVYNLTVLLSNTTFDDYLWFAHSPQFIELRRDFELGVLQSYDGYDPFLGVTTLRFSQAPGDSNIVVHFVIEFKDKGVHLHNLTTAVACGTLGKLTLAPSLGQVGECWSGVNAEKNYKQDGPSQSCLTNDFRKCGPQDKYCVGEQATNFVYTLNGYVYNLTLELTNTPYDDGLSYPHAAEFIALRTDFEVGILQVYDEYDLFAGVTTLLFSMLRGTSSINLPASMSITVRSFLLHQLLSAVPILLLTSFLPLPATYPENCAMARALVKYTPYCRAIV
ncbi:hypothetical protein AWC38_SpisGene4951 [Stylophora pistillata]|uniref:Uncharacterized protein n=1 Tax=Stylophora pistillata TaxID=50429 RepID=A0A2B4SNX3_STYPI|nr:hypothetical protein AWC38_SpisGene4951 [Stylophora pistillata]